MSGIVSFRPVLGVKAIYHKLWLLSAFKTFWPAAFRGGRLLFHGRFREFRQKLFAEVDEVLPIRAQSHHAGSRLFIAGYLLGNGGYDQLVAHLIAGLRRQGVHLARDEWFLHRKDILPQQHRPERASRQDEPRLLIAPPQLLNRFHVDRRTVAFTMWETDTLPRPAVKQLNQCGLVLVPSQWGARCFRANGVTTPIEVVPLGFDPRIFSPTEAQQPAKIVQFGTAGALDQGGLRKNVQRVIDLFRRAFPNEHDVRLRVKITPSSPRVETFGDPRIDVIQSTLTPDELANWYRSLTAFVNLSHGEGFGLHLLEAMACGRPLISTTFSGVSEFFDSEVGYVVSHQRIEARNAIYQGGWADPCDEDVIAAMHRIRRNPSEAHQFGQRAALRARSLTWDEMIRRLLDVLSTHQMYVLNK